jgi:hypothetical protein
MVRSLENLIISIGFMVYLNPWLHQDAIADANSFYGNRIRRLNTDKRPP